MSNVPPVLNIGNLIDKVGSRALDTIYQNGAKSRLISVNIIFKLGDSVGGDFLAEADLVIGAANPPTEYVLVPYVQNSVMAANVINYYGVIYTFIIPPNYYYQFKTSGNAGNLGQKILETWHEVDLW